MPVFHKPPKWHNNLFVRAPTSRQRGLIVSYSHRHKPGEGRPEVHSITVRSTSKNGEGTQHWLEVHLSEGGHGATAEIIRSPSEVSGKGRIGDEIITAVRYMAGMSGYVGHGEVEHFPREGRAVLQLRKKSENK